MPPQPGKALALKLFVQMYQKPLFRSKECAIDPVWLVELPVSTSVLV